MSLFFFSPCGGHRFAATAATGERRSTRDPRTARVDRQPLPGAPVCAAAADAGVMHRGAQRSHVTHPPGCVVAGTARFPCPRVLGPGRPSSPKGSAGTGVRVSSEPARVLHPALGGSLGIRSRGVPPHPAGDARRCSSGPAVPRLCPTHASP